MGHFRDKSLQAVTYTHTDNSKQTGVITPKMQNKQTGQAKKTHTQKILNWMSKAKPAGHITSTSVRTACGCVLITVYNCGTQYSTEQFW